MAQIEIIALNKTYLVGETVISAVNDVSLSVSQGDFMSIVGHSGSGKTTLVSMIGGILRPSSGQILYGDEDICLLNDDRLSEYRNTKIGFMFQFASLLPILNTRENVQLPSLFGTGENRLPLTKVDEYLEMVGLQDKLDAYPSQLSGGQQRRVAIARALVTEPEIILADEPTGDLDEETEAEILELFQKINRENKVTIILITHNLELAGKTKTQLRMTQGELVTL